MNSAVEVATPVSAWGSTADKARLALEKFPNVQLALLFGSVVSGKMNPESDLDIAVAAPQPITWREKMCLIEELALIVLRPIDLLDLQSAHGLILKRALTTGSLVLCKDRGLYARLIGRMLFEQADFQPLVRMILRQRIKQWIAH